jgi:hypothetical protein
MQVSSLNAEHTIFQLVGSGSGDSLTVPLLGERVTMVPVYSDATTLLHRRIFGVRGGIVEAVYDIQTNGKLQ